MMNPFYLFLILVTFLVFTVGCGDERPEVIQEHKYTYATLQQENPCAQHGLEPLEVYTKDLENYYMICIAKSPFYRRDVPINIE